MSRPGGCCSTCSLALDCRLDAVARLTMKGLRHTWATLALEQGIHPRVVQERRGHSTIAITLGIYSHVTPNLHDEATELIATLVLGGSLGEQ